jgi:hypothetical protein
MRELLVLSYYVVEKHRGTANEDVDYLNATKCATRTSAEHAAGALHAIALGTRALWPAQHGGRHYT